MMQENIFKELARPYYSGNDRSHDFLHIERVIVTAKAIQSKEGGDLDILIPAAYFHDCIKYEKSDPRSKDSAKESAEEAGKMLESLSGYLKEKIYSVKQAIIEHSFSGALKPSSLESMILQDADRLDTIGATGIMRAFSSANQMNVPFYDENDPFCDNREVDGRHIAVDFLFARSFEVGKNMNTQTAREMAEKKTKFIHDFLDQLSSELGIARPARFKLENQMH